MSDLHADTAKVVGPYSIDELAALLELREMPVMAEELRKAARLMLANDRTEEVCEGASRDLGATLVQLKDWAADQRERESWRDEERSTYKYRADLLDDAVRWLNKLRGKP